MVAALAMLAAAVGTAGWILAVHSGEVTVACTGSLMADTIVVTVMRAALAFTCSAIEAQFALTNTLHTLAVATTGQWACIGLGAVTPCVWFPTVALKLVGITKTIVAAILGTTPSCWGFALVDLFRLCATSTTESLVHNAQRGVVTGSL